MAQQEGTIHTTIDLGARDDLEKFLWKNEQILTKGNRKKTTTQFYDIN